MTFLLFPFLLAVAAAPLSQIPSAPLAQKGPLLLSEDFEKPLSDKFRSVIPTFKAEDGVWKGVQTRDDHGAVGSASVDFKDAVIEFKFKLSPGTTFNAVCDDHNYKGSHAGHLCRVQVNTKYLHLGDDKEGIMRNDIYDMMRDPAKKAEGAKLSAGRDAKFDAEISVNEWHRMAIEISGDQMRVLLDGQPAGYLRSSGIAHPTKTSFHFTTTPLNKEVAFDELRVWSAAP